MSDILIRGMEMPKKGARAFMIVFSNGKAAISVEPFEWHEVIPVPDHGDLIDRNKLKREAKTCIETTDAFIALIDNEPTIIPARKENK